MPTFDLTETPPPPPPDSVFSMRRGYAVSGRISAPAPNDLNPAVRAYRASNVQHGLPRKVYSQQAQRIDTGGWITWQAYDSPDPTGAFSGQAPSNLRLIAVLGLL